LIGVNQLGISGCEDIWILLDLTDNKKITVVIIYRHPNNDIKAFLDSLDNKLETIKGVLNPNLRPCNFELKK